jgi:putative FmdB family regulatory protein
MPQREEPVPTYQYACTECGERTEVVQKFTDETLTVCTVCEGRLRKVYSPVGIVFKGSGFYRTDSRNGANGKKPAGSEAGSTASKSANGDSGSSGSGEKKTGGSADSGSATAPAAASSKSPSSAGTGSKVA